MKAKTCLILIVSCLLFSSCAWYANPITEGIYGIKNNVSSGSGPESKSNELYFLGNSENGIHATPTNVLRNVWLRDFKKGDLISIDVHNPDNIEYSVKLDITSSCIYRTNDLKELIGQQYFDSLGITYDLHQKNVSISYWNDVLMDRVRNGEILELWFYIECIESGMSKRLEDDNHPVQIKIKYSITKLEFI